MTGWHTPARQLDDVRSRPFPNRVPRLAIRNLAPHANRSVVVTAPERMRNPMTNSFIFMITLVTLAASRFVSRLVN